MKSHSKKPTNKGRASSLALMNSREESRVTPGFFLEEDSGPGQFDMNADLYRQKQIELANRIEDLTGVAFWETKEKFNAYDYHLCKENDPKKFAGTASVVPGIPMYWQKVDVTAELKYRTIPSGKYKSTILDADKMKQLKTQTREMGMDTYLIWAFTDRDMYMKLNLDHHFPMYLGRNTTTTDDLPYEYKPQVLIPMHYLQPVTAGMFNK